MSIVVTGSNGFLGSRIVHRLLSRGNAPVRCFVRRASNTRRLEELQREHGEVLVIERGSLADVESAKRAIEGATCIVHAAATVAGSAADLFAGTVVATKHLLDACAASEAPPRIVLVSSFGVYGVAQLPKNAIVDENAPLEPHPEQRDVYSHAKLRQEELAWRYRQEHGLNMVVLRPGVIYGPGGGPMSARVGIQLPGLYLYLGGDNLLPLSYVDNCAEACAIAAERDDLDGQVYNVHDDDLPTAREFLRDFQRNVRPLRIAPVPFPFLKLGSHLVERYHAYSKGQLPAIFTPYKTDSSWKPQRYDNSKLKKLGWRQLVSTSQGMGRHFQALPK